MKIPFSPSVYEHAAFLIGRSPWDVSRGEDLLFLAHRAAYLEYKHSPIMVGIDIYNIEAEAYGCVVENPSGNGIPAITKPLFTSLKATSSLSPFDPMCSGRIPMVLEVGKRLVREFPDTKICIPLSGPFSIAVSLRGINGFLEDVALFPKEVSAFLMRLVESQIRLCSSVIEAGLNIAFFESAAAPPLLSPEQFRHIELPALKETMTQAADIVGHSVPCIIGGNTEPILEDILDTGTDYVICPAETDQSVFMAKLHDYPEVKVRVNLDPYTVAYGSREQILAEVDRILTLINGRTNVLLGTGAVPYETPPANIKLIRDYVSRPGDFSG